MITDFDLSYRSDRSCAPTFVGGRHVDSDIGHLTETNSFVGTEDVSALVLCRSVDQSRLFVAQPSLPGVQLYASVAFSPSAPPAHRIITSSLCLPALPPVHSTSLQR